VLTTHSLTADSFLDLAIGEGDGTVIKTLGAAQHSKHLMQLVDLYLTVAKSEPSSRAAEAFLAGFRLLDAARAADPSAVARLLSLPYIGSWAHLSRAALAEGSTADLGYLAAVAVAAATPLGVPFEIDVPVRRGGVSLPGLGTLWVGDQGEWIRLSSDGNRLMAGTHVEVACSALVRDDGAAKTSTDDAAPRWRGTPVIRAVANGLVWEVLIEHTDAHLDRYSQPMLTTLTKADLADWRRLIQSAWELLVRYHPWAAEPIAEGVTVIVPLAGGTDPHSAASPTAFGAIATSPPLSPVSLAETLIHEFQHVKLSALTDMMPLVNACDQSGYAPWRPDPRPMSGLLQGVYAFAGIARFWDVQRGVEADPDDIFRASVLYERWRSTIEPVCVTLLDAGALTQLGVDFVTALREREQRPRSEPVLAEASEMAAEIALDNWLTWQLRHVALDPGEVAGVTRAFLDGGQIGVALPEARVERDIRKVDSLGRSKWLSMRLQDPQRYNRRSAADTAGLAAADALLIRGDASAAVAAYREGLIAQPDPAGWIGLALAINRLPTMTLPAVFATQLPLLFELHASLAEHGVHADPLDVAARFE
jgi:HEXXH motif-containing protein